MRTTPNLCVTFYSRESSIQIVDQHWHNSRVYMKVCDFPAPSHGRSDMYVLSVEKRRNCSYPEGSIRLAKRIGTHCWMDELIRLGKVRHIRAGSKFACEQANVWRMYLSVASLNDAGQCVLSDIACNIATPSVWERQPSSDDLRLKSVYCYRDAILWHRSRELQNANPLV